MNLKDYCDLLGQTVASSLDRAGALKDSGSFDIVKKFTSDLAEVFTQMILSNPPKHKFWRPGDSGCPRDIKAENGELHTLRCKSCGEDNPINQNCLGGLDFSHTRWLGVGPLVDKLCEAHEGTAVIFTGQNPDFNGLPNEAVTVVTAPDWKDVVYRGDSLVECLNEALTDVREPSEDEDISTLSEFPHILPPYTTLRDMITAPSDCPLILRARHKDAAAEVTVIGWYITDEAKWIDMCFAPNTPQEIIPSGWFCKVSDLH